MIYAHRQIDRSILPCKQAGVSITTVIMVGLLIMLIVYISLKTLPLVIERYKIDGLMNTLTAPEDSVKTPASTFSANLLRQLDLQDVRRFSRVPVGDFLKVNHPRKKSDKKSVTFFYTASEQLYKELYVTIKFEKTYIFGGGEEG